ncbi:ISAs1 family transposase, partial [Candidatus Poribacteria bacterium]
TLTQQGVSDKTNEIPVSTEILKNFDLNGKVITTDALLTQKTFCQAIIAGNRDYVLPVKNNQPELYDDIQKLFQDVPNTLSEDATHPPLGDPIYTHETHEKSHGRLETRCLKASTSLNAYLDWPGIAQVLQYRYTDKNLNTGEETTKVQYGRTSLTPEAASAERLLELRRGHWSIENKSHWIRDTQLGEDASPVRCGAIPQVMAALRNAALAVLRFAGVTRIADKIKYYASKHLLAVNLITECF